MEIKERVLDYIEKNKTVIINFLRKLVSFQSITGNEGDIQSFIADYLKSELNLSVDVWEPDINELKNHPGFVPVQQGYEKRPNVVGVYRGAGGGRSLLFNGHVDVIPPGDEKNWRHAPWSGFVDGEKIYGRGASDMKAGLAAYTMAMKAVLDSGAKLKGDVILEYVVDEELSGNGTLAAILRGYRADAGISAETSSLKIQPACIGRIWFEIDVYGKPAGIQRKWEGINAINLGYKLVKAVDNFEKIRMKEVRHSLFPNIREAIPCLVGVFSAGSYPSSFPDFCVLRGSMATVPGEDSEEVKKQFREHIETFSKTDPWLRHHPPIVRFTGYFAEPSEISVNHPIVDAVCKSFTQVTGMEPIISGRLGATDARFLNKYGNTPTVIFGPGLTEQMHAVNEYVNVKDLITATKVMALTILDWCGYV